MFVNYDTQWMAVILGGLSITFVAEWLVRKWWSLRGKYPND